MSRGRSAERRFADRQRRGFSLFELLLVLSIVVVMAMAAVPSLGDAAETGRLRRASAELESLWLAQRLHWVETGRFAESVDELAAARLLPGVEPGFVHGYRFLVRRDALDRPRLIARREGSSAWSGELTLDAFGRQRGEIRKFDGDRLAP